MATTLQLRRGNTQAANAFTGAEGELFIDLENKKMYMHDGTTVGGIGIGSAILNIDGGTPSSTYNIVDPIDCGGVV